MKMKFTQVLVLLMCIASFSATAQQLEQVDMSSPSSDYDTYVTGINNSGYVTGYYTPPGGSNVGFIITPTGKKLLLNPAFIGATDTKVESINNHGVAVMSAVGSSYPLYKVYVDTVGDSIGTIVNISNVQQTNAQPVDINDLNDMSGWYQGSQRWLYVQHDSIVPGGNSAWEANRYQTSGPTYYNSWGTGINNANKVAGFWVDGSMYTSYIYDNITHTFDTLASTSKVRTWDINNNNIVCGEYQQTNGFWMAYVADVSSGSYTAFNSLDELFDANTIQSIATGINDQGEIVGNFTHPGTGKSVGFIYHPADTAFMMPGFTFVNNTWGMKNSNVGTNPIWTSNYYGSFDYTNSDPYANINNGIENYIATNYNGPTPLPSGMCVAWLGFATEIDASGIGVSTDPTDQQSYLNIYRDNYLDRWVNPGISTLFAGYCYGFSYTSLFHLYENQIFPNWFNLPLTYDTYNAPNTDVTAIKAVERTFIKQSDVETYNKYGFPNYNKLSMWGGLYRLKNTYRKSFTDTDPPALAIYIGGTNPGYHSILPYRVKTPTSLPFDHPTIEYDTLYIYDSNYPHDSSQYFTVNSYKFNAIHDSIYNASYPDLVRVSFNKPGVRFASTVEHAQMKSTAGGVNYDAHMVFNLRNGYYNVASTNSQASVNGSGYTFNDNTTEFIPYKPEFNIDMTTTAHTMDTVNAANITTYNYTDSLMSWVQSNKSRTMKITRDALPAETDHSTQKNRLISYGNPDNVTKYLNAQLTQITDDISQATNIKISGICAAPGDSIVTESPTEFVYKVTKVVGTTSCAYNLSTWTLYNGDSVKEFHADIPLDPNSSHTIDPYYDGGTQVVVSIDNGNDGSIDDTIVIAGWPVGIEKIINEGGIKVYPNPVQDELTVEFAHSGDYNIMITDVIGKVIYNNPVSATGKIKVPMAGYAAGVYLIQVADSKGAAILKNKIIKQ